jgi:hypothetical protein
VHARRQHARAAAPEGTPKAAADEARIKNRRITIEDLVVAKPREEAK